MGVPIHMRLAILTTILSAIICLHAAHAAGPGAQYYNEFLEKDLIYPDEEWQDYVTEIGERLLAHTPHKGRNYNFVVTSEPRVNAFATQDAYIFVTRGIIAILQNEDELAGERELRQQ